MAWPWETDTESTLPEQTSGGVNPWLTAGSAVLGAFLPPATFNAINNVLGLQQTMERTRLMEERAKMAADREQRMADLQAQKQALEERRRMAMIGQLKRHGFDVPDDLTATDAMSYVTLLNTLRRGTLEDQLKLAEEQRRMATEGGLADIYEVAGRAETEADPTPLLHQLSALRTRVVTPEARVAYENAEKAVRDAVVRHRRAQAVVSPYLERLPYEGPSREVDQTGKPLTWGEVAPPTLPPNAAQAAEDIRRGVEPTPGNLWAYYGLDPLKQPEGLKWAADRQAARLAREIQGIKEGIVAGRVKMKDLTPDELAVVFGFPGAMSGPEAAMASGTGVSPQYLPFRPDLWSRAAEAEEARAIRIAEAQARARGNVEKQNKQEQPMEPSVAGAYVDKTTYQTPPAGMTREQLQASGRYVQVRPTFKPQSLGAINKTLHEIERIILTRPDLRPPGTGNPVSDFAALGAAKTVEMAGAMRDPDVKKMSSAKVAITELIRSLGDDRVSNLDREVGEAAAFGMATREAALSSVDTVRSILNGGITQIGLDPLPSLRDAKSPADVQKMLGIDEAQARRLWAEHLRPEKRGKEGKKSPKELTPEDARKRYLNR